jgi:hypothetical protein
MVKKAKQDGGTDKRTDAAAFVEETVAETRRTNGPRD